MPAQVRLPALRPSGTGLLRLQLVHFAEELLEQFATLLTRLRDLATPTFHN